MGALVITRRVGDRVHIGDDVVTVLDVSHSSRAARIEVRGVDFPLRVGHMAGISRVAGTGGPITQPRRVMVQLLDVSGTTARIRIEAPGDVAIHRHEHFETRAGDADTTG